MSAPHSLISTDEALDALLSRLAEVSEIALDTEFHSEGTYWPRLMLVQLATRKEVAVVDPLAAPIKARLPELFQAICGPRKVILGHALENDLAFALRVGGVLPSRVFDTQIAAGFAGRGHPIGLGQLASDTLGVELDKSFAASNWAQRPLSADQLEYAMDDVRHMVSLTEKLGQELAKQGRLAWVVEECGRLLDAERYAPTEPRETWRNVRRRPTAEGAELTRLRELAAERERLARELDLPRLMVLPDDALVDLARRGPTDEKTLRNKTLRRSSPNVGNYGSRWLAAIARAAQDTGSAGLLAPTTPAEEAVVGLLRVRARAAAVAVGVAPGLLLEPIDARLVDVVRTPPTTAEALVETLGLSDGWRADLLAEPLMALIEGKESAALKSTSGALELVWR